jgi:hypothetical protein
VVGGGRDAGTTAADLEAFDAQATVVFDPLEVPTAALDAITGPSLGVLVGGLPTDEPTDGLHPFDRLASFRPSLTGETVGGRTLWRAFPPPISDALFADVRPLRRSPRVMSVGRSTPHREDMLLPAKHHCDLLQLIAGVSGESLRQLLAEYDVGVYVPPKAGGGFGQQVGMHLAAGQLLLAERLAPAHGLERDIDYLDVRGPGDLVTLLDRLARFPEMYQRIRVRGRLKAEQYRSSRLFARVIHDLLADIAAFGPGSAVS